MRREFENLPEQIQNMDMCLLSDWNKYFQYPKLNSFRQMLFHNKYNGKYVGLDKTVRKIGSRIFIKISTFFEWLDNQTDEVAQ